MSVSSCLLGFLGLVVLCFGTARAAQPEHLVLLPFGCVGGEASTCERLRQDFASRLAKDLHLKVVLGAEVDKAVQARCGKKDQWWACMEQDANLFALGAKLGVPAALTVRVASLGKRNAVKLRWVDVEAHTISVELVEAGPGALGAWVTSLNLLLQRTYPPPPPAPSWYKRWEVWTAVGAGAALITGAVLAATLTSGDGDPADFHLRLP